MNYVYIEIRYLCNAKLKNRNKLVVIIRTVSSLFYAR